MKLHKEHERLGFDGLTLRSPEDGRVLVKDLTLTIPQGTRVLVTGAGRQGERWRCSGRRRVVAPWGGHGGAAGLGNDPVPAGAAVSAAGHPARFAGAHRARGRCVGRAGRGGDGRLGLAPILARAGGLDTEQDWDNILSLAEQQLLAVARLLIAAPPFAMLEHIDTTLGGDCLHKVLGLLGKAGITYVVVDGDHEDPRDYEQELHLNEDGSWELRPGMGSGEGQAGGALGDLAC